MGDWEYMVDQLGTRWQLHSGYMLSRGMFIERILVSGAVYQAVGYKGRIAYMVELGVDTSLYAS